MLFIAKFIESDFLQAEVELIRGNASFTAEGNVIVDNKNVYKAKHILIATGGHPTIPEFPGTILFS